MTQKYYSFVTNLGLGQITNAVVLGGKVDLKYFAVGDGGGESYTPDPSMTTLKNEVWRGNITGYRIDAESQNDIFITGIVPANVGGFTIREMAAFDSNGTMIAIATLADIVKPTVDEGESADAELTIHITVENSEVLNCTIDPNAIVATKADVKKMGDSIKNRFGQPNGIATLNSSGKLAQMPTAADVAALPASAISSSIGTNGTWRIKLPGGIIICTGAQTWTNVAITDGGSGIYRSQILYFDAFPQPFAAAPHCIIGIQVGESNPYWIAPSDYGTTTTKPQGFRMFGIKSMTLSTVTISYIAIGLSS